MFFLTFYMWPIFAQMWYLQLDQSSKGLFSQKSWSEFKFIYLLFSSLFIFLSLIHEEADKIPEVKREGLEISSIPQRATGITIAETHDSTHRKKIVGKNHEKQNVARLRASEFWPVSWGLSQVTGGMD